LAAKYDVFAARSWNQRARAMLIGAAVCPHPPILVPAVTGGRPARPAEPDGARELDGLRAACDEAVAGLLDLRPDVLVIAGGAPRSAEYPMTSAGCLSQFGVWSDAADGATRAALGGWDGAPVLPLSLTIGRWLVDRAGQGPAREGGQGDAAMAPLGSWAPAPGGVRLHAIADSAPVGECLAAGARMATLAPRVALLVMGDGPARRARGVAGAPDPEADRYDAGAAAAFAGADAQALAALGPARSATLLASGRASWQVLAGAVASAAAGAAAGGADGGFRGRVAYAGAPFEVSYFVAAWHRER
jgi:hypothetical protein